MKTTPHTERPSRAEVRRRGLAIRRKHEAALSAVIKKYFAKEKERALAHARDVLPGPKPSSGA